MMQSVEIFTGAGGLAMGVSLSGFEHRVVIERNRYACDTIRENQRLGVEPVVDWPLHEGDVRQFRFETMPKEIDLVAGGPPCQPFSLGGKHWGPLDERDMFPTAASVIRQLKPRAFLFENVKGLLRQSFAKYFEYILLQLTYPFLLKKPEESWNRHLSRLEEYHTKGKHDDLMYHVTFRLLNAADYGVPQRRERVFIVGFRSDTGQEWSFPDPTHSWDALLWDQWITSGYWDRHRVAKSKRPHPNIRIQHQIEKLRGGFWSPIGNPWCTVRDAITDLPDPRSKGSASIPNHSFNPGARSYPGHTGSPLDEPAKTLKAGDHGVPGGENTVVLDNGTVRYLTVRECARLQTFPDGYIFQGTWSEAMRQLGNAVPVSLAAVMAGSIAECLQGGKGARDFGQRTCIL